MLYFYSDYFIPNIFSFPVYSIDSIENMQVLYRLLMNNGFKAKFALEFNGILIQNIAGYSWISN